MGDMIKRRLRKTQKSKSMVFNKLVRKFMSTMTNSSEKGGVGCGGGGGDEGDEKANDEKPGEKKHVLKEYRHNVASDDEGHLKYKLKDNLLHYQIETTLGEGTFGKVVACRDHQTNKKYAIKIIKNIARYREAARLELDALYKLKDLKKQRKCPIVEILDAFDLNGHICLVFPVLGQSTYDYQKANSYRPYELDDIKSMSFQLLTALKFLHKAKCTHTDIKPENVLFRVTNNFETVYNGRRRKNERRLNNADIVLIDLGSAVFEWEHHSRVVSTRHYRAPEVILGLGWGESIDIWSLGCLLFEYYTGKTMFQTHDNIEHLAMMESTLGKLPSSMVRETKMNFYTRLGANYALNWDENTDDGVYVKTHCRPLNKYCLKVTNPQHNQFFNLIQSMLTYSPTKRPTPEALLGHPFFAPESARSRRIRSRQASAGTLSTSSSQYSTNNMS